MTYQPLFQQNHEDSHTLAPYSSSFSGNPYLSAE
jgi:hypothetical protein